MSRLVRYKLSIPQVNMHVYNNLKAEVNGIMVQMFQGTAVVATVEGALVSVAQKDETSVITMTQNALLSFLRMGNKGFQA